jgi:hypothetical protein
VSRYFYTVIHRFNFALPFRALFYFAFRLFFRDVKSDIHLPLRLDNVFIGSVNSFRGKKWDKVVKTVAEESGWHVPRGNVSQSRQ